MIYRIFISCSLWNLKNNNMQKCVYLNTSKLLIVKNILRLTNWQFCNLLPSLLYSKCDFFVEICREITS